MLLLDLRMPGLDGFACLESLSKRRPDMKVVVISALNDPDHIESTLKRGASGYIVKSVDPVDLLSALRQAATGAVHYSLRPNGSLTERMRHSGLTEREDAIAGGRPRPVQSGDRA